MRVSVCNWATTDSDIDRALASVREALTDVRLSAPRGKR
jgi:hypothetical protein